MPQRVIIADDHPLILRGPEDILIEKGHVVLYAAKDGKTALKSILKFEPEVAMLDIHMPQLSGLQIAQIVRDKGLLVKIILITIEKDPTLLKQVEEMKIDGYILKEFALAEIEPCLKAIADGTLYYSPHLTDHIDCCWNINDFYNAIN